MSSQISENSNNSRHYKSNCYNDPSSGSKISDSSNSKSRHYKESDYYDQNIVNNLWEESRKEMKLFCKEYGVKQESLQLFLELNYNLIIHNKIRVNKILYNCNYHEDWDYFVEK